MRPRPACSPRAWVLHEVVADSTTDVALPVLEVALPPKALACAEAETAVVARGVLRALSFIHNKCNVIHRDVKPQNILLDGMGIARLTDFDLVWAADTTGGTRTGFLGTHLYAAPEQAEDAKSVDARADTYSLAMTTLFVLFGRSLPQQAMYQRALFIDGLPCGEPAKALLRQATAIDPDDRPASIASFCRELASVLRIPTVVKPSQMPFADGGVLPALSDPREPPIVNRGGSQVSADVRPSMKQSLHKLPMVVALAVGLVFLAGMGGHAYRWLNPPPPADPESDAAKLLIEIDADMASKRWMDARAKANRLSRNPAVSPKTCESANSRRARADLEVKVQPIYDRFLAAGENYDLAMRLYSEIPTESAYHQSARAVYEKLFPHFVANHLKAAEYARVVGMCDEFRSEVKIVLDVDPKQIRALNIKELPCAQQTTTPPSIPQVARHAPILAQAAQKLRMAQTEFDKGNYIYAISLADSVKGIKPTRAWRIIGVSACHTKDISLARESLKHLDAADGQHVVYVCQTQRITNIQGAINLFR